MDYFEIVSGARAKLCRTIWHCKMVR